MPYQVWFLIVGGSYRFLYLVEYRFDSGLGDIAKEGVAEHFDKVFDAILGVLQFGRAIEMRGEADTEASFFQQGGVFADGGEVPDLGGSVAIVAVAGEGFTGGYDYLFYIPFTSHFEHEPAAGAEVLVDIVDGAVFIQYPVQGGVGEDGVKGGVEVEVGSRAYLEVEVGVSGLCSFDHGGGFVDADDAGSGLGDEVGQVAGTAAEIEDTFALL